MSFSSVTRGYEFFPCLRTYNPENTKSCIMERKKFFLNGIQTEKDRQKLTRKFMKPDGMCPPRGPDGIVDNFVNNSRAHCLTISSARSNFVIAFSAK